MTERIGAAGDACTIKFIQLIRMWPDESWSFAVNPGTAGRRDPARCADHRRWPAGPTRSACPTSRRWTSRRRNPKQAVRYVRAGAGAPGRHAEADRRPRRSPYYLERGYDRVSGFVHRASEVAHLNTPRAALPRSGPGLRRAHPFKRGRRRGLRAAVDRLPARSSTASPTAGGTRPGMRRCRAG